LLKHVAVVIEALRAAGHEVTGSARSDQGQPEL